MPIRIERPVVAVTCLMWLATAVGQGQPSALVPESFTLSEAAGNAIDAAWLTEQERATLRVFHGVWDDKDVTTPEQLAIIALNAWRLDHPVFDDPDAPVELRAEARLFRGDVRDAIETLGDATTLRAARLRAEAYETLGEHDAALDAVRPAVQQLLREKIDDAAALTDGVQALAVRARLEGQPARDYRVMMQLLGRAHQELDRLYWPARLAEAELLLDKHNRREAVATLHETMSLNPRSAWGWYHLGRVALTGFDFDSAAIAQAGLRRLNRAHPLASLLQAESRLIQNDPDEALEVLDALVERWPRLRRAHALRGAATALLFDVERTDAVLDEYAALSPGSADALYEAGRFLSMFRQYDEAARRLEAAIERNPGWPAPRLELALMEMQTGRDDRARAAIEGVVALDPFNKRVANSELLLEELSEFAERETPHFIIRYKPGIDEVLVDLMPEPLERIHEVVAGRFGWELPYKTIIELMPDHQRFAVRITGMPHIHTIAACTGPIIALEVPRDGPSTKHLGPFDWQRVLQHEYTHTITLEQTKYRIPHWLTEAAAVSMEEAPRDYGKCMMLAQAYRDGTLFDLDEIKWAFVRPKKSGDRSKAYAQGHWMVEFMNERFGSSALVDLLERYFEGEREEEAIPNTFGISRAAFFDAFLVWAGEQVKAWGLAPEPSLATLTDELRWADPDLSIMMAASQQARLDSILDAIVKRIGTPSPPGDRPFTADQWPDLLRPPVEVTDDQLEIWRTRHPDHPDLLRMEIERRFALSGPDPSLVPLLERLIELRPVDEYPHRKLAQIRLAGDDPFLAVPHLEALDVREEKTPVYAHELARLYRDAGRLSEALDKVTRAASINPYVAETRELAAAIAMQSKRLDLARVHIRALTLIEPDRPRHLRRLERIDELLAAQRGTS